MTDESLFLASDWYWWRVRSGGCLLTSVKLNVYKLFINNRYMMPIFKQGLMCQSQKCRLKLTKDNRQRTNKPTIQVTYWPWQSFILHIVLQGKFRIQLQLLWQFLLPWESVETVIINIFGKLFYYNDIYAMLPFAQLKRKRYNFILVMH